MDDEVLDETIVESFSKWCATASAGDVAIVTTYSAGSGVTTAIRRALKNNGCEAVRVSTDTTKIGMFLADASMSTHTALVRLRKIILVDPCDAIFAADPVGAGDIVNFIKTAKLPTVLTGFLNRATLARVLDAIPKTVRAATFQFPKIRNDVARRVLEARFPCIDRDTVQATWSASDGDLRASISALSIAGGPGSVKDIVCDGLDALKTVLFRPEVSVREAMRLHAGDSHLLTQGAFENYLTNSPDIRTCSAVADAFSDADIIEDRVFSRQQFDLMDFHSAVAAGAPAVLLPKTSRELKIDKVGSVWSRTSNMRAKQKSVETFKRGAAEANVCSGVTVGDLGHVRDMLVTLAKSARYGDMIDKTGELGDAAVLVIIRLFKTNYTASDHSKFRKARRV